jgi:hypothetical protein
VQRYYHLLRTKANNSNNNNNNNNIQTPTVEKKTVEEDKVLGSLHSSVASSLKVRCKALPGWVPHKGSLLEDLVDGYRDMSKKASSFEGGVEDATMSRNEEEDDDDVSILEESGKKVLMSGGKEERNRHEGFGHVDEENQEKEEEEDVEKERESLAVAAEV